MGERRDGGAGSGGPGCRGSDAEGEPGRGLAGAEGAEERVDVVTPAGAEDPEAAATFPEGSGRATGAGTEAPFGGPATVPPAESIDVAAGPAEPCATGAGANVGPAEGVSTLVPQPARSRPKTSATPTWPRVFTRRMLNSPS
jgi:hypothetical protein